MIEIAFPNGRVVRAIILNEPAGASKDVRGLVECSYDECEWRAVLYGNTEEEVGTEMEDFAKTHECEANKNTLLSILQETFGGR